MFPFPTRKPIDTSRLLRRVIDVTTPNRPVGPEGRSERRFNRMLPAVIAPASGRRPDVSRSMMAITQDISDRGISVVALEMLQEEHYFVSVWPSDGGFDDPLHFRCKLANCRSIAHGFWVAGFTIESVMNLVHMNLVSELNEVAMTALRAQPSPAPATG